jgi:adenylate cyclase
MSQKPGARAGGFRQTLRLTIVTVFTFLLTATVLAVILSGHRQSSLAQRDLTDVLFQRVTRVIEQRTTGFLAPARGLVEVHARQYEAGAFVVDPEQPDRVLRSLLDVLALHPDFAFLYFALPDGAQLAAERLDGERFVLWNVVEGSAEQRGITRTTVDLDGAVLDVSREVDPDFRIAERPWFVRARDRGETTWSDPYVFFATRPILGITVSHPVQSPDGTFAGVFGADVDLASLSGFLHELRLGETGMALVVDGQGHAVAFPGYAEWIAAHPDAEQLPSIDELGLTWVQPAIDAIGAGQGATTVVDGAVPWLVRAAPMHQIPGTTWHVVVGAPVGEFVGPLWETNRRILLGSLLALLLGMLAVSGVSRGISRPVVLLADQTQRVAELDLSPGLPVRSRIWEVQLLADAVHAMKVGLGAFLRYVPATLVKQVIESGEEVAVGGRDEELTLFFSDVQGFTTISEGMEPQALAELLSEYLEVVTGVLLDNGATVDKYIGDGVMAFWGAPLPDPDHAVHACRAAVVCQQKLDELNARWEEAGRPALITRIGIHTGHAVVGNVGSSERLNYTAMGDAVNTAARLEGANKQFGTRILISSATHERLGDDFESRPLGDVELKGKTVRMEVFELLG